MNPVQAQLMACLSAYAKGEAQAACLPACRDWQALYRLAEAQKLTAAVYETLRQQPEFCADAPGLRQQWKLDAMGRSVRQVRASSAIMALSEGLDAAGVPHAVVKGIVCRELYSRPDLRPSGDEDLLIRAEDIAACSGVLEAQGFRLEQTGEAVTHWLHGPSGLHLELHTALLSGEQPQGRALNDRLVGSLDRTELLPVTGGRVRTLPPTEHFVFLVCHVMQHFVAGGVGVRTLCDAARFAEAYADRIDRTEVRRLLEPVRGLCFLDQLFALGRAYWGCTLADWTPTGEEKPEALLQDSLEAGIYGQSTETRKHSGALAAQTAGSPGGTPSLYRVVFLPKKTMTRRYPVLERHPALLPLCHLHRLGRYGLQVLARSGKENSPAASLALGKQRIEMMVQYGIFPEAPQKNK